MKKNNKIKQLALERVCEMLDNALNKPDCFTNDHIRTAKKIATKYRLKMSFEYRMLFCKNCKRFIVPGKDSRIRIGKSKVKALRITCKMCGHTYRKVIKATSGV